MDSVTATLNAVVLNAIKRAACDAETARKWAAVWTAHCAQEETEVQAARLLGRQLRAAKHFDIARALALGLSESDHSLAASALAVEISMRLGDTDEALRVSQELRQRFPRSPQAMRLQLDALVALSRSAEAQAVLDELPPAHRDAPWAARARAALQVAPPEAVPALEAAPEPVTVSEAALVADAQSLLSENRVDDASAMIGSCLRRYPASIAAMRVAAEIAERRGCMDEALARWADIRAAAPRSPSGYMGALRCLRRFGRLELGRPILAEGREKLWDNADFSAFAGQYTAAAKLLAAADEWLQRAVYLSPGDPHVALSAAIVLSGPRKGRKQRMPTVLARLDEHHETFPDYAPAYAAHIDALRNAGALFIAKPADHVLSSRPTHVCGSLIARLSFRRRPDEKTGTLSAKASPPLLSDERRKTYHIRSASQPRLPQLRFPGRKCDHIRKVGRITEGFPGGQGAACVDFIGPA